MITAFIPTYRRPLLLKRAIQSVLDQSFKNFQICVLDNASGDETESVVKEFMEKDSRVKYICHVENLGMMGNYAYAFSHVETPFFHILSDDDYLLPLFFETALAHLKTYPDAAYCSCCVTIQSFGDEKFKDPTMLWSHQGYVKAPYGAYEMTKKGGRYPIPTGVMFRQAIASKIKPDLSQKIQLMWDPNYLLLLAAHHPIIVADEPCAMFHAHDDAYSSGFYEEIKQDGSELYRYYGAYEKMIYYVETAEGLTDFSKSKILKNLKKIVRRYSDDLIFYYTKRYNRRDIERVENLLDHKIGKDQINRFVLKASKFCNENKWFFQVCSLWFGLIKGIRTKLKDLKK